MKNLTILLAASGLMMTACSSPESVAEYRRVGTVYTEAPVVQPTQPQVGQIRPIDPYYTGTTYQSRTLYGRPNR